MKKLLSTALCILLGVFVFTGCSGADAPYVKKTYTEENQQIMEVCIDVRDRLVEVMPSADGKLHIDYYDNGKETYDISVSADQVLTMRAVSNKKWTDYIGGKAPAEVRKISLQIPDALLNDLSISTTNEDITIAPLTFCGNVTLKANGGSIIFDQLTTANEIVLDVKNGSISGTVSGSYDEYAISCTIKKGESNLPAKKENGNKKLTVTANNADVTVEIG